jgi:predicted CopG family antitoxin
MSKNPLKLIAVSPENYQSLKSLGRAGDSFNDVVTKLLHSGMKIEKDMEDHKLN